MLTHSKKIAALVAFGACAVGGSLVANPVIIPTPLLPPPNTSYGAQNFDDVHALYNAGLWQLIDPIHWGFLESFPPPDTGGSTEHSFGSTVNFSASMDNGITFNPFSAPAAVKVRVDHSSDFPGGSDYDTEMTQLDIAGGTLPPGILIRESPTLQSTGKTKITQVPTGYEIQSYFDIYTEISVDGGSTWFAQENGPTRVTLRCPDSGGTTALLGGSIALLGWARRRK